MGGGENSYEFKIVSTWFSCKLFKRDYLLSCKQLQIKQKLFNFIALLWIKRKSLFILFTFIQPGIPKCLVLSQFSPLSYYNPCWKNWNSFAVEIFQNTT